LSPKFWLMDFSLALIFCKMPSRPDHHHFLNFFVDIS
jgi:hypothetical protein